MPSIFCPTDEVLSCTGNHTLTQANVDAVRIINTVTASASAPVAVVDIRVSASNTIFAEDRDIVSWVLFPDMSLGERRTTAAYVRLDNALSGIKLLATTRRRSRLLRRQIANEAPNHLICSKCTAIRPLPCLGSCEGVIIIAAALTYSPSRCILVAASKPLDRLPQPSRICGEYHVSSVDNDRKRNASCILAQAPLPIYFSSH